MKDWQKCCLAYQGDTCPCDTPCNHCALMAKVVEGERERCARLVEEYVCSTGILSALVDQIRSPTFD